MVDKVLNLLVGCRHKRITRPITPVHKAGAQAGDTYVACLDCGRQFHYDVTEMRMGTPMPKASPSGAHFQTSC